MEKLIRYTSIEELKADTTPARADDAASIRRHEQFADFLTFLKAETTNNEPAPEERAVQPNAVYGL